MRRKCAFRIPRLCVGVLLLASWGTGTVWAQTASLESEKLQDSVRDLQTQIRELQSAVAEIRAEAAQYRAETKELRGELAATRAALGQPGASENAAANKTADAGAAAQTTSAQAASRPSQTADRTARLEEQYELLAGKVDDQYQTKVESASKYRVRLSGIVLLNLFSNQGSVDNADVPSWATPNPAGFSGGSFGGTLRQSQIGLEIFGPRLGGARTRADLQMDFAGGFPQSLNGVNTGLVRLRTGTIHIDWERTSIVGGQDGLFFAPQSPTSFASLATPAFAYSGNLWNWVPQVRVERHIQLGENSRLLLQGGILDGVTGEPPTAQSYRAPQAGESARQPAFAGRAAFLRTVLGQPFTIGAAGYFNRQDYGFSRTLNGWAGMTDWNLGLGPHLALSGEFYRGLGIGGLGGGIGRSVIFSTTTTDPKSLIVGLNDVGGWAQLKVRANPKVEFNGAYGEDNPFAADLLRFPYGQSYLGAMFSRNQTEFGNVIYRPRSDLLFSAEYRHLKTSGIGNSKWSAGQVNLMMGVLF
jgi:regulator of replication initiation timing